MGSFGEEQFCLRWNDFESSIASSLTSLRRDEEFLDVTLWCAKSNDEIGAHKLILSACSGFFRSLLRKRSGPNPLIVLWDVSSEDLESVLAFMYNGEVKVKEGRLNSFLSVAEKLQVRGLCKANTPPDEQQQSNNTKIKQRSSSKIEKSSSTKRRRSSSSSSSSEVSASSAAKKRTGDYGASESLRPVTVVDPSIEVKDETEVPPEPGVPGEEEIVSDNQDFKRDENSEDLRGDYSEYGYDPTGCYEEKQIPPPVVGMTTGDPDNGGPWSSPGSGGILNKSMNNRMSAHEILGRRPRSVYTAQQLSQLEAYFRFNEYIDGDRKKQLSHLTKIPEQQIKVWFQNRRQKKKRELEEQPMNQDITGGGEEKLIPDMVLTESPHHHHLKPQTI